ncbi:DUF2993 domain-containing protein [Frankia sp. CcI49]|uniref:LmeA family phospholipid-binding protein n=1 Tax=Frankia sp. CcI49 TaxID=1745382 RepID=UPI001F516CB4|nr:DUF2993 domain-containing protein [Frankia sp. CcI49]
MDHRPDDEVLTGPGGQQPPAHAGTTSLTPWHRRWWPRDRRPRRRRSALAFGAVILLVVLIAGDRFAVSTAESEMATQIKASVIRSLACDVTPPTVRDVSIGGFPFLTQIAFGRFRNIGVIIDGVPTPGPRISSVEAHLKGIHLPIRKMLANDVGEIPVDNVEATVHLDYADVNAFLADQPGDLQINPVDGGKKVEVAGLADVPVLGAQEIGGVIAFEVRDNKLTLIPSEIALHGSINVDIPVPGGLGGLLPAIPIPVGALPFDLTVVEASSDAAGLSLTATARRVVLPEADTTARRCPAPNSSGP